MYNLRERGSNIGATESRGYITKCIQQINIGYILIIIAVIIFFTRAIGIINKYQERGAYPYIQLLNITMPIVENQIYDKLEFEENELSLKRIVLETLGLYNFNSTDIIGREFSLFKGNHGSSFSNKKLSILTPFSLKDDSIVKVTPEELAELNAESPAYDPSLKKPLDNSKPEILIYSTHTTEGFAEAGMDTNDTDFNILGVGEVLAKELEEGYGLSVIHDKTNHTLSGYNSSYNRSQETLKSYLDKYGDFKLIIDLHRDSVDKSAVTTEINGQSLAKIMLCRAENSARYEANKKLSDEIFNISERLFPGLSRNIWTFTMGKLSIHQGLSDNTILIELGSNTNTAQEAKLSAKYVARILAEYLNR